MRVIRHYDFQIGTKIPYAEWPVLVHRFLEENGLKYNRFMYYFEHLVLGGERPPKPFRRLLADCPSLGEPRYWDRRDVGLFETCWLSNIDQADSFPEDALLPLMKKIQHSYGFGESGLYYYDIDFFGSVVPFERNDAYAQEFSRKRSCTYDPTEEISRQPCGSGITLFRDRAFGRHGLRLSVDVLRDGQLLDASSYCEAMQRLLPGVKVRAWQEIVLSEEEKQRIADANLMAEPVLERCRVFFRERLRPINEKECISGRYSVAKAMKKTSQEHGYTYQYKPDGAVYVMEKRTSRGNVLHLMADGGPRDYDAAVSIGIQGVGFRHHLGRACPDPVDQTGLEADYAAILEAVAEFEQTLLSELEALFPECPEWFEAVDLP